jgi:hypothetical protein
LHRYGHLPDCVDKYYLIFGDFDEQYKAFSLAPLLTKLLPVQSVASVTFYTWIFVARLAVDFVAASQAAAAGARGGTGPTGAVCAPDLPVLRLLLVCVVVSPMHAFAPDLDPALWADPRSEPGFRRSAAKARQLSCQDRRR